MLSAFLAIGATLGDISLLKATPSSGARSAGLAAPFFVELLGLEPAAAGFANQIMRGEVKYMTERPLAIDLFCGLFGWSEGLTAEGFKVVGFDLEDMCGQFGFPRPSHCQLVIQDVLTLHGSQFKNAALIVASPPCQFFSYTAMPWTKAKALAKKVRADPTLLAEKLALFNACFRIQREACEAAGRHIPMVVENVRGAEPWVGRARFSFGSYLLWGDVPALMPIPIKARKNPGFRFDGSGRSFQSESVDRHVRDEGRKTAGMNWSDRTLKGQDFTRIAGKKIAEGRKGAGAGAEWFDQNLCALSSKSPSRKAASAMIAKIPLPLSRHIARTYLAAQDALRSA